MFGGNFWRLEGSERSSDAAYISDKKLKPNGNHTRYLQQEKKKKSIINLQFIGEKMFRGLEKERKKVA